jgi:NMD protein affecting ribosome stability and mRNA decay
MMKAQPRFCPSCGRQFEPRSQSVDPRKRKDEVCSDCLNRSLAMLGYR